MLWRDNIIHISINLPLREGIHAASVVTTPHGGDRLTRRDASPGAKRARNDRDAQFRSGLPSGGSRRACSPGSRRRKNCRREGTKKRRPAWERHHVFSSDQGKRAGARTIISAAKGIWRERLSRKTRSSVVCIFSPARPRPSRTGMPARPAKPMSPAPPVFSW